MEQRQTYPTFNHLVRDLAIDLDHWINADAVRFRKFAAYNRQEPSLRHIPQELLQLTFHCPNGHQYRHGWLDKVPPTSVLYCQKRGLLRQQSYSLGPCPECDEEICISLPNAPYHGNLQVFGDEAIREVNGKTAFVYTFLTFNGPIQKMKRFERRVRKIKRAIAPTVSPDAWQLHMKELTTPERVAKAPHLAHLSNSTIERSINDLLHLLGEYRRRNLIYFIVASGVAQGKELKKRERTVIQRDVYGSALLQAISRFTNSGLAPRFYFEKTGTDGWARRYIDGVRLTLIWPFIANGLPVGSPQFVPRSFNLMLELADVVSYVVARTIFCIGRRAEGHCPRNQYDLTAIGDILHVLTMGDGRWEPITCAGYPAARIFRGTEWEAHI